MFIHDGFSHKTNGFQTWETSPQKPCLIAAEFQRLVPAHLYVSSIVLNASQAGVPDQEWVSSLMTPQWQHWPYSIILSPCLFCLFVLNSPGSLMETDTIPPRKGMTFTTPLCSCKWRDYLAVPHQRSLGPQVSSQPGALGVSFKAGGFSSQGASDLNGRLTIESEQNSSKYPLPVSEGCWQVSKNLQLIYVFNAGLPATAHFRTSCSPVQY